MINIVTTCGLDPIILHHFIKHYKDTVDKFFIVLWGSSKQVKYNEIIDVLNEHGLNLYLDYRDQYVGNAGFLTKIYNTVMATKQDDWWIVADIDEFQVYPEDIKDIILKCEKDGYQFVTGGYLDKISKTGEFLKLEKNSDIWSLYPLGGTVGYWIRSCKENNYIGSFPSKVTLMKGHIKLAGGQHYLEEPALRDKKGWYTKHKLRYPTNQCFVQVHHMKWTYDLYKTTELYSSWDNKWWSYEHQALNDYIIEHNGIDITNKKFMLQECSQDFNSYARWNKVRELCVGFEKHLLETGL